MCYEEDEMWGNTRGYAAVRVPGERGPLKIIGREGLSKESQLH